MKRDWNPDEPEWMDEPQPVSERLRRDLENIGELNQRFGSHALITRYLRRWYSPGSCVRLLDLCTGYGDIPRMICDWGRENGVTFQIDTVERHPATLEIAREQSRAYPNIRFIEADALSFDPQELAPLPHGDARYDLVHCSLSLHHFSEGDAACLLRRCRDLSRGKVLIADLQRNRLSQLAVWLVTATLYRDAMTRHDARLSVRRAFSRAELARLAQQAGWTGFRLESFFPTRQALWLEDCGKEA